MCRSAARIWEGLSWGSRWYKPKEGTLSGAFFDPGRLRSAGTGAQIWGKEKAWSARPLPVAGAVRFDRKLYGITKREGRVWGNRRFLPHMERSGSPRRSGRQKKKAPFGALFFWCGRWDSNPHTEVLASKTRASTIPPLPLISLWPCTFTKQQADKYPYYTIFSLVLSIPRPVSTVRGLPVYRRCVRIES